MDSPKRKLKARSSVVEPAAHNSLVAGSIPAVPTKKSKYRDPEKRKAYMRDLMRARRAKENRK
jgi:hypothetical protein